MKNAIHGGNIGIAKLWLFSAMQPTRSIQTLFPFKLLGDIGEMVGRLGEQADRGAT